MILWSGVAVGALVVVAVVSTFFKGPELDPGTPEGVVQRYLQAVVAGRAREARSYLSDRLQHECDSWFPDYLSREAYRIEWIETEVEGSEAEVEVLVIDQSSGIFDSYYDFHTAFTLRSSGDGWRITDQEWPWYECSESRLDSEEAR